MQEKMKRTIQAVAAMAGLAGLSGCATIAGRQFPSLRAEPSSTSYYPATVIDGYVLAMGTAGLTSTDHDNGEIPSRVLGLVMIPLGVIDLPISLVTDTLLLPFDLARAPAERDRRSRTFDMAIGVQTTNALGLVLVDTSQRGDPNPPVSPPWAAFRDLASGRVIKVTWPSTFGCADNPDTYRLECVFHDGVRVERMKRKDSIQQAPGTRR
jgi:uncharacterized protein YceK